MSPTYHVLGASGFLGGAVADRLARRLGSRVRRWSSASCDLLDSAAVEAAFGACSKEDRYVFCAAIPRTREDSPETGAANRFMLEALLRAIEGRFAHFVFLGSADVYGRPAVGAVLDESSPLAPEGPYAASKAWCETRLENAGSVTVFRLPGVYGEGDGGRSTAGVLSRKILAGEAIALPPKPALLRDFVTARGVAALVDRALEEGITGTFQVATGQSLPLRDIVSHLATGLRLPAVLTDRAEPSPRDFDLCFDTSRLRAAFAGAEPAAMPDELVRYGEQLRRHGVNQ